MHFSLPTTFWLSKKYPAQLAGYFYKNLTLLKGGDRKMARKDDEPKADGNSQEAAMQDVETTVVSKLNAGLVDLREFLSYLHSDMKSEFVRDGQGQPLSQTVKDYIIALWSVTCHLMGELHPRDEEQKKFQVSLDAQDHPLVIFSYGLLPKGDGLDLTAGTMNASCRLLGEKESMLTLDFQPRDRIQSNASIVFRTYPSDRRLGGVAHSLVINDPRVELSQTWTVETFIS